MANIRLDIYETIYDGYSVTFKAPCACTSVTGIKAYYPVISNGNVTTTSKVFTFKDAHGNALTGMSDLFSKDSYVVAILDVTKGYAYLQNADTNMYLENRIPAVADDVGALAHLNAPSLDMDELIKSGAHAGMYRTTSSTPGTPYNKGVTTLTSALILSYASSATYGHQIALATGGPIFHRRYNNGTITDWVRVYSEHYKPSLDDIGAVSAADFEDFVQGLNDVLVNEVAPIDHTHTAKDVGAVPMVAPSNINRLLTVLGESATQPVGVFLNSTCLSSLGVSGSYAVGIGAQYGPGNALLMIVVDGTTFVYGLLDMSTGKLTKAGTFVENLVVEKATYPSFRAVDTTYGSCAQISDYGTAAVFETRNSANDTNNRRRLSLRNTLNSSKDVCYAVILNDTVNGSNTQHVLYGTFNMTCGTSGLVAGSSALPTYCYYDMYE